MDKFIFCLISLIFFQFVNAQENNSSFELGVTLASIGIKNNFSNHGIGQINDQYLDGIVLKCNRLKWSIRGNVSYLKDNKVILHQAVYYNRDEFYSTDFKVGVGAQLNLLKHKNWVYGFFDLGYRKFASTDYVYVWSTFGNYYFNYKYKFLDAITGIGLRLRIYKGLDFSPEIGLCFENGVGTNFVSVNYSKYFTQQYNSFFMSPMLRFQLLARFN